MSNLENIIKIHNSITQLTGIENKYKITNICSKLIRISFEYIKKLNKCEILIIPAYENCLKILIEYINSKKIFKSDIDLIETFMNSIIQLEKLNTKKPTEKEINQKEDQQDINFIN